MYKFILVEIVEVGLFETSSSKVTGIVMGSACQVQQAGIGQKDCEGGGSRKRYTFVDLR